MYELSKRERRFVDAYSRWYARNATAAIFFARELFRRKLLPRKVYSWFIDFAYEAGAGPLGSLVGSIYFCVTHFGDLVRYFACWLVYGPE